jgi:hypothetical protein
VPPKFAAKLEQRHSRYVAIDGMQPSRLLGSPAIDGLAVSSDARILLRALTSVKINMLISVAQQLDVLFIYHYLICYSRST